MIRHRWLSRWMVILTLLACGLLPVALASGNRPAAVVVGSPPRTGSAPLTPALVAVPSDDGTALYIDLAGVAPGAGTLFANIGIGPGHNKGSWTMTYSETAGLYITTAAGFSPGVTTGSTLDITTTTGLRTSNITFTRAFVPDAAGAVVATDDGMFQLSLFQAATLPANSYVAVAPSFAPPGPPPPGHQVIGSAYSVRASGAVLTTTWTMDLRIGYSAEALAGADPQTLAIAFWDPGTAGWTLLPSRLAAEQRYVSAGIARFGTYALLSVPAWHDDLDDIAGVDLALSSGVDLGLVSGTLALVPSGSPGSGVAVSLPIAPAGPIAWGTLAYTATVPPGADLRIDVLAADGAVLAVDLPAGADLAALIDGAAHPALRLRARLEAGADARPALFAWRLTWRPRDAGPPIYLPLLTR